MSESIMTENSDIASKKYKRISELPISELIQITWILVTQSILSSIEEFFYQFQWYRKRCGGKWSLKCHHKKVYWSPDSSIIDFVDVMAIFGEIVDVIKTEDWTNVSVSSK